MPKWGLALSVATGLVVSAGAEAQFANHSIGLSVGYLDYAFAGTGTTLRGGPDLGIDYSLFFESGVDLYARSLFGVYVESASGNVSVPIGGGIGARYLFSQEYFQPYVGLAFNFTYFTFQAPDFGSFLFGFSAYAGAQYYVNEGFSIGATVEYDLNFAPQGTFPLFHGVGVFLRIATHF